VRWIVTIVADDCFYYFKIAQNLVATGTPTFDGVNLTNGFHPAWMAILVGLVSLFPEGLTQETVARILLFAQWPLVASGVSLLLLYGSPRPTPGGCAFSILAILGVPFIRPITMGLETSLAFLCFAGYWLALARSVRRSDAAIWPVGLLAALWELARLDSFLISMTASALALLLAPATGRGRESPCRLRFWRSLLIMVGPTGIVAGGAAVMNKMSFGHYLTVSAYIKSGIGVPSFHFVAHELHYPIAAGITLAVGLWSWGKQPEFGDKARMLCVLSGAVLIYCGVFPFLIKYPQNASWYYYTVTGLVLVGAMMVWNGVEEHFTHAGVIRGILVTILAFLAASSWIYFARMPVFFTECYDVAIRARQLPAGSVLAFTDAGSVGFFSLHPTVDTDGLANSFDFLRATETNTVSDFLKRSGVTHVVIPMRHVASDLESGQARYYVRGRHGKIFSVPDMPLTRNNLVAGPLDHSSLWGLSIFKAEFKDPATARRAAIGATAR